MSNSYTKNYTDGPALTEAELDAAFQSLQLDVANTALTTTGSSSGQALLSNGSGIAASFQAIPDPLGPFALRNYGLKASAAAGTLVISLKTKNLTNPTASDYVDFTYSTHGTTSATYSAVQVTAATSISLTASATLGAASTSTVRIYAYGYYNTATSSVRLALSARPDLDRGAVITTVLMNSAADDSWALYATASLSVFPRLLGWVESAHNSGGSWQTPTKVNVSNNSPTSPFELNRAVAPSATARLGQVAISPLNSGSFSTSSATFVAITNLSVTITTTGRPVLLQAISDTNSSNPGTNAAYMASAGGNGAAAFFRDSTQLSNISFGTAAVPVSVAHFIDSPSAGTYTYTMKLARDGGSLVVFTFAKLVAREL